MRTSAEIMIAQAIVGPRHCKAPVGQPRSSSPRDVKNGKKHDPEGVDQVPIERSHLQLR